MSSTAQKNGGPASSAPTQDRILDAAQQCMELLGISRMSVADVARLARVSRGSIYAYFGDRAGLVDAVLARAATRYVASSAPVVRRRRRLVDQVAEAAVFIHEHSGGRAVSLRLEQGEESLLAVLLSAQGERLAAEWVAFWQPFLEAAERRGELPSGLDHREVGEAIVRLLLSFAVMPAVSFDADDPAALRRFVRRHLPVRLAPRHDPPARLTLGRTGVPRTVPKRRERT